ncbi:hypothetical protein PP301_gp107 [Gordonia phage GMA2]|uniref:Uncharacterized protein n=1 Tax=Gordonia phage GMA2 TaxID=1647283 RepID=A0A0K0N703_9CAUD|nr:hypothetical protein PP301_gp107 [Gordonia phage GMA2]AKJ72615.1 hypothetical protein GMA2_77 [Gordonia phage GMA2]
MIALARFLASLFERQKRRQARDTFRQGRNQVLHEYRVEK